LALLDSEVWRIKHELGYNVLTAGAEPYVNGVVAVFNQVIQQYLEGGASTTCSTTVAAATTPTPVTLALASAAGFSSLVRIVVDVDARQEVATVQNLTGANATVLLSKAHSGTYPVWVEGGESIVRGILNRLWALGEYQSSTLAGVAPSAGIKAIVGEIEFETSGVGGKTRIQQLQSLRNYWRNELASALGVENLHTTGTGSASTTTMELY